MARARRNLAGRKRMKARVKVWLEIDGRYVFGFGLSEILKAGWNTHRNATTEPKIKQNHAICR